MINLNEITKKIPDLCICLVAAFCFILLSCNNKVSLDIEYEKGIEHGIVFYGEGLYGGWPANYGIWSWSNEILVGYNQGKHDETRGFHTLESGTARAKYARSMDGGISWTIEDAYERGQIVRLPAGVNLTESIDDFTSPDFILAFRRGNAHTGPTIFFYSNNRGKNWEGPFDFPNFGTPGIAGRTDYIVDSKQELGAFITVAKSNYREGRVAYTRTEDGALNWELVSWIGPEPEGFFDIMPSSVRLSPTELITTIRTGTGQGLGKITAYISEDNGTTWERLRDPVADTGRGGSPSALVKLDDGRLALGYIYRSEHGSRVNVRFSSDNGRSWSDEIMLRGGDGANRDTGYPVMVQRPDGKLVIIYYWNNALNEKAKPYRYIAYTVFDPDMWK